MEKPIITFREGWWICYRNATGLAEVLNGSWRKQIGFGETPEKAYYDHLYRFRAHYNQVIEPRKPLSIWHRLSILWGAP